MIPINAAGVVVNFSRLALAGACGVLVVWLGLGMQQAMAAAVGVVLAIANTRILSDTVQRAGTAALQGAAMSARGRLTPVYAGMILRWLVLMTGLAVGIGWLGLSPVGLLAGYGVITVAAAVIVNSRH